MITYMQNILQKLLLSNFSEKEIGKFPNLFLFFVHFFGKYDIINKVKQYFGKGEGKGSISMKCPICQSDSKVVYTRLSEGNSIRRRRECMECGKRFTTYEKIEDMPLVVIKKDGRKELFDGGKILKGINKACEKRPISMEQQRQLVNQVERELKNIHLQVPSAQIGETVMQLLAEIDEVAYVRFASVYKEFDDVETFIREIEIMKRR